MLIKELKLMTASAMYDNVAVFVVVFPCNEVVKKLRPRSHASHPVHVVDLVPFLEFLRAGVAT